MRLLVPALVLSAWLTPCVLAVESTSSSVSAPSSVGSTDTVSATSNAPSTASEVSSTVSKTTASLTSSSSVAQSPSTSTVILITSNTVQPSTSSLPQTFSTSYTLAGTSTPSTTQTSVTATASSISTSTASSSSAHASSTSTIAAKVCIIVGSVLGAAAVAASIWFLCRWHRRKKDQEQAFEDALRQSQVHEEMSKIQRFSSQPSVGMSYQPRALSTPRPISSRADRSETPPLEIVRSISPRGPRESWRSAPDLYRQRESWRTSPEPRRDSWRASPEPRESWWTGPEPRRHSWNSAEYQNPGGRFYAQQTHRVRPETIHENQAAAASVMND